MKKTAAAQALSGIGLVFGTAAVVAPGPLAALYGMPETTPQARQMTRMWGTALIPLSFLAVRSSGRKLDEALLAIGAADVLAALTAIYSGVRDGGSPKATAMTAATSAAVAAGCLYARKLD